MTFADFASRYRAALTDAAALADLQAAISGRETVTLLYGAKDAEGDHAQVLAELLGR